MTFLVLLVMVLSIVLKTTFLFKFHNVVNNSVNNGVRVRYSDHSINNGDDDYCVYHDTDHSVVQYMVLIKLCGDNGIENGDVNYANNGVDNNVVIGFDDGLE